MKIGAAETVTPAHFFPTDVANCRGSTTADLLYDILGFRDEGDGCALVISTANKEQGHGFTQVRDPRRGKIPTPACLVVLLLRLQWSYKGFAAQM